LLFNAQPMSEWQPRHYQAVVMGFALYMTHPQRCAPLPGIASRRAECTGPWRFSPSAPSCGGKESSSAQAAGEGLAKVPGSLQSRGRSSEPDSTRKSAVPFSLDPRPDRSESRERYADELIEEVATRRDSDQ